MNIFLLCFLIFACQLYISEAALKTLFAEDLCFEKKSATVHLQYDNSIILMSRSRPKPKKQFNCEIIVKPANRNSVVLSIYQYDISSNDELTIEDSDGHTIGLIGWGIFKTEKKSIMSDGRLTIRYFRSNSTEYSRSGFQFTLTEVNNYPCYANEFRCNNDKCILDQFACDGHNHCGDNSDQLQCVPGTRTPIPSDTVITEKRLRSPVLLFIIAVVLGGTILVILVVVFMVILIRRSRMKNTQSTAGQVDGGDEPSRGLPMQSVSSTVQSDSSPSGSTTAGELPRETFYNRVRRSLRGDCRRTNVAEVPTQQETYQVPSMYPKLDPVPSAPSLSGEDNPNFKAED